MADAAQREAAVLRERGEAALLRCNSLELRVWPTALRAEHRLLGYKQHPCNPDKPEVLTADSECCSLRGLRC